MHEDETMLMDMSGRDFLVSDSETSEMGDDYMSGARTSGRGIIGAGRLMTPENSQENQVSVRDL